MSDTRKSQFSQKILFHVSPVIHIKSISIAHKNVMIMNISSMCLIGMNESELGIMPVNPIVLPFFFKNSSQPRTLSPSLSLSIVFFLIYFGAKTARTATLCLVATRKLCSWHWARLGAHCKQTIEKKYYIICHFERALQCRIASA